MTQRTRDEAIAVMIAAGYPSFHRWDSEPDKRCEISRMGAIYDALFGDRTPAVKAEQHQHQRKRRGRRGGANSRNGGR